MPMPMETIDAIALTLGVAWASGINLYAAIVILGWFGMSGDIQLPPDLQILANPVVIAAAGLMYCVEFFADKTPGVDTGWDILHTFIRIPAGALLAAGASQGIEVNDALQFAAFLVGGGIATTTHLTKASARVLINTSPEPVTNWTASFAEDIAVIGAMWAALHHPWLFLAGFTLSLVLIIWLLPRLWRALGRLLQAIGRFFRGDATEGAEQGPPEAPGTKRREILRSLYHDAQQNRKPD